MKLKALFLVSCSLLALLFSACVPSDQMLGLDKPFSGRDGKPRVYFLSFSPALRTYALEYYIEISESHARLADQGLQCNIVALTISALEVGRDLDISHLTAADQDYLLNQRKEQNKLLSQIRQMDPTEENVNALMAKAHNIQYYTEKYPNATPELINAEIYPALIDELGLLTNKKSQEELLNVALQTHDPNAIAAAVSRSHAQLCREWAAKNPQLLIPNNIN